MIAVRNMLYLKRKKMITTELNNVYITSDGTKFFSKSEAERYEKTYEREQVLKDVRCRDRNTGKPKSTTKA